MSYMLEFLGLHAVAVPLQQIHAFSEGTGEKEWA